MTNQNENEGYPGGDPIDQSYQVTSNEIILPPSVNGRDRYLTIEKITAETVSPLLKKDLSVDTIYEVIDRNFSYPLTAHVGLKFDSRTFSQIPSKEFDVKMKKIKVPSNYFPIGGNGLDRRYVYSNPDYDGNPTTLDLIFMVDQNLNSEIRLMLLRNLKQFLAKLISGYTNVRFSIWQTAPDSTVTTINESTGDSISGFTYSGANIFLELETVNSDTNLFSYLYAALNPTNKLATGTEPNEGLIVNFFLRKSVFSLSEDTGTANEKSTLERVWKNTVRKVIYFSGSTPNNLNPNNTDNYSVLLNNAAENGIQLYYFHTTATAVSNTTLRELAVDTGGGAFNYRNDSDAKLQQFCDANFYDSKKIYYGNWDGNFKIAWTDNPAWILYDIITDYNYGLGNFVEQTSIDKWTLYDIGRYCDAVDDDGTFKGVPDGKGGLEPRYTCNIIFYNKDEAYNVLKDIAAIFKGIVYWNTEGFSFFVDKPKEPIMYFANINVKDGIFQYTETARNKRYTMVEIVYNDRYDDYKTKVEFVEDIDGVKKFGINPFKVNAAGCTSRSEAKRIGKYILCSSMFESDTVTFTAGLEGAYLQPGDVFGVSDEIRNVGRSFGRILEIDEASNILRIDGEFKSPTQADPYGLSSGIYVHIPSGNFAVSDLNKITGSNGDFTGTLEQIRARRQSQTRKFNIHTVTDEAYGSSITVTGDFLLQNAVTDVYAIENRVSGDPYTGQTILTGIKTNFDQYTIVDKNPRWDTLTFSDVSGRFSELEIDIDFMGSAGTGQLIGNEANWTAEATFSFSANSTLNINGSTVASINTNQIYAARLTTAGAVQIFGTLTSLNQIFSHEVFTSASNGQVIVIITRGTAISNSFVANSTWETDYAATEIYKIGDDTTSASSNFGYVCAFVKGGYRILERASKMPHERGSILFTYRDLLALSKLRGYYTFMQADVGNRAQSAYLPWVSSKNYYVGDVVQVSSVSYMCTKDHISSTNFNTDYAANNSTQSKWALGNNLGYYTIGFPENFYGTERVFLGTTLTATHVSNAFKALGIDPYVGSGPLGQSDLRNLSETNGIGYTGLIYGTGFPRGFYNLSVDTTPKNLDLISEGSIYVLNGSGVEPKLYKTIGIKEEEANQYTVLGIEYLQNKQNYIEKDLIDLSPTNYVRGPYDVVTKPEAPSSITSLTVNGAKTEITVTWGASPTNPILGYKVYVSKPDYSTLIESDSVVDSYTIPAGTTTLTIPVNGIYGQYDIKVYAQGTVYKLLSNDAVERSIKVLPNPTLVVEGQILTSTFPSGLTIETADVNSVYYVTTYGNGTHSAVGAGNFTSADVTFRWKYIDPTGGVIDSVESMLENPFLDLPPNIKIEILNANDESVYTIENYQGFSYTLKKEDNMKIFRSSTAQRYLGFRITVKDNTNISKTGIFRAYNLLPQYSNIEVIDSYQNSPYYVLSGYYGNSTFTSIALWNPQNNTTTGIISGSGLRNWKTADRFLLRSEDESRPVSFEDISGAFFTATGYDGTGIDSVATLKGVSINYRGTGKIDFDLYVKENEDLLAHYNKEIDPSKLTMEQWGKIHYIAYGYNEPNRIVRMEGNEIGFADLSSVPVNKTGFSGVSFTTLTENISKGLIIFNCFNSISNKDVYSVDVFTGDSVDFIPDTTDLKNFFGAIYLPQTRAYINTIEIGQGLELEKWYYFRFRPWDDIGEGLMSNVVSGYLERVEEASIDATAETLVLDGGRGEDIVLNIHLSGSLVKDRRYKIISLGTNINWTTIGAESATLGIEFTYNGSSVTPGTSGGRVQRVEQKYPLPQTYFNNIVLVTAITDSTIVIPSAPSSANRIIFISRRSVGDIYIEDANGNNLLAQPTSQNPVAVPISIKPNETVELRLINGTWISSADSSIYV